MCPRRCRWVMYYWAFSPYGLFGVDCLPKALPLGYGLLDFQSVWIVWGWLFAQGVVVGLCTIGLSARMGCVGLIICPRCCHWVIYYWAFSPCGLFGIDYLPKVIPLGYELLGFQPVWVVWGWLCAQGVAVGLCIVGLSARMGCLGLIICLRYCRWVMDCWTFSPYGLFGVDCLPKALPLGYVLLGF